MASSVEFVEAVCERLQGVGELRYRKMFGEYVVYVNEKPIILVCDDTVYLKEIEELKDLLAGAERGIPYDGAKERYIVDIDDVVFREAVGILEAATPLPKKKLRRK